MSRSIRCLCVWAALLVSGCASADAARYSHAHAEDPCARVFRAIKPSIALVTVVKPSTDRAHRDEIDEAYGTASVIASGSWGSQLLTAEHVVHGHTSIKVKVAGKILTRPWVVASDATNDVALLQVADTDLPALTVGRSDSLEAGDPVGVAGFPIPDAFEGQGLGIATSVYFGRIASVRRGILELDLPIIPGDSGGPVFDAKTGSVLGIADSRFDDERAIGFAVPTSVMHAFLKHYLHT